MDEHAMARVIEILETDPDFFVPVKKLWSILHKEGLALGTNLETFTGQLAADDRFEFFQDEDHDRGLDPELVAEMAAEMETLGLFSGPRVKWAAREMTAEDVFAGLSRSLQQLNNALRGAWENRPEADPGADEMLQDALAMAEQLERDVHEMIEEQREQTDPEDKTS